jgi:putative ABC transport system permease protein
MQKFLSLAITNVFRNKRRTLMTLLVVSGGVAGLLLTGGFFAFMFRGLREQTIRNRLGHLQINNANTFRRDETHALENGLEDYGRIAAIAFAEGHVRGVAPRIEFCGMVSNGMKSSGFMGSAVDPESEKNMGFAPRLVAGRDLNEKSDTGNDALLGVGLARSMNAKPGDRLTLLAVTADGALNGIDVDVVGTLTTSVKDLDDRQGRLP